MVSPVERTESKHLNSSGYFYKIARFISWPVMVIQSRVKRLLKPERGYEKLDDRGYNHTSEYERTDHKSGDIIRRQSDAPAKKPGKEFEQSPTLRYLYSNTRPGNKDAWESQQEAVSSTSDDDKDVLQENDEVSPETMTIDNNVIENDIDQQENPGHDVASFTFQPYNRSLESQSSIMETTYGDQYGDNPEKDEGFADSDGQEYTSHSVSDDSLRGKNETNELLDIEQYNAENYQQMEKHLADLQQRCHTQSQELLEMQKAESENNDKIEKKNKQLEAVETKLLALKNEKDKLCQIIDESDLAAIDDKKRIKKLSCLLKEEERLRGKLQLELEQHKQDISNAEERYHQLSKKHSDLWQQLNQFKEVEYKLTLAEYSVAEAQLQRENMCLAINEVLIKIGKAFPGDDKLIRDCADILKHHLP